MAKFQKGVVYNPKGAGAHNQNMKALRRLTRDELAAVGSLIVKSDVEALKQIKVDAEHPDPKKRPTVLSVWIASVAIKAINTGDMTRLNQLLDRIVGKVKDEVEVSTPEGKSLNITSQTAEEREAEIQLLLAKRALTQDE